MLFALLFIIGSQSVAREHVDLVELNSFHDASGRLIFDQLIFWEWHPGLDQYHVRAWTLTDNDKQPQRDYRSGKVKVRYLDRELNLYRGITATHYRRSYTQTDPERANKKLLAEEDRHGLIKRLPPQPIPDDEPMAEDFVGGSE